MNLLESLKRYTTVVADTGDFDAIAAHQPQDATTNPSLIFQAAQKPHYQHLVDEALGFALATAADPVARSVAFIDKLFVSFGCEILKIVPGRVSTEVDAGLSFDTEGTVTKARKLIGRYQSAGVGRERVLIKIASTWEGILAAEHKSSAAQKMHLDEKAFRWMHNEDAMATEKLAEGIRKFYADARKLEQYAQARVSQKMAG